MTTTGTRTQRAAGVLLAALTFAAVTATAAPAAAAGTPPQLTGLQAVGSPLNVTTAAGDIVVSVHYTGGDAGIASATVTAQCQSNCGAGTATLTGSGDQLSDATGGSTPAAGVIDVDLQVPQTAAAGGWTVTDVTLIGADSSQNDLTGGSLAPYAADSGFTVSKTADSSGPRIGAISFPGGTAVNTTKADADIVIDVALTDATPGVGGGSITLTRSSDNAVKHLTFGPDNLISGTLANGVFEATLPGGWTDTDGGTWHVSDISAADGYGNQTDDPAPGGAAAVTVTTATDTTAPAVAATPAPAFSPSTVDATTGPATATLSLHITDDASGFVSGQGTLSDGNPAHAIPVTVTPADRISGTSIDGSYAVTVAVPQRQPAGSYHFTDLTLTDRYGNSGEGAVLTSLPVLTVTTTADSHGPSLGALTVGPATLNEAAPGAQLAVVAHASDDVSGISEIDVTVTDAAAGQDAIALTPADLVSGTATSGTFATTLPADLLATGTATITSVDLSDVAGNTTHLTTGQVSALPARTTVSVVDQPGDAAAPAVSQVTLAPTSVSTTGGPGRVTVTAAATDAGSAGAAATGVASVAVTVSPPGSAGQPRTVTLGTAALVSGDPTSGSFSGTLTIPQYAVNGTWSVTDVDVTDAAGNSHDYSGAGLSGAGAQTGVTVTGPVDHTPPALASLTGPAQVDAHAGAATAAFTAAATDDASGVCSVTLTATSPNGDASRSSTWTPSGACPTSASAPLSLTFGQFVPSGAWRLSAMLVDGQGNQRALSSADLTAAHLPATLSVTAATDSSPPTVAGIVLDPASGDVTAGPLPLVVDAHLRDTAGSTNSGVATATLGLLEPDGTTTQTLTLRRITGSPSDGWWQGGLLVPQYAETGAWTLDQLTVSDAAGNTTTDQNADLTGAGLPGSFDVTGTSDTTAPQVAGIQINPASVSITGQDGLASVTLHLTDDASGVTGASFDLVGPDNTTLSEQTGTAPDTGTPLDGTWSVPVDVPAWSATGAWHVDDLLVGDAAGNYDFLQTSDLDAASLPDTLNVTGTTDTNPPALTGLSVTPSQPDTSASAATITVSAHITDDASGFGGGTVTVQGPSGNPVTGQFTATPTSGTATDGHFAASLQLPRYSPAGSWHVTDADLFDNVGREKHYTDAATLTGLGGSFTVTDSAADTKPPTLASLSFSRANVDENITAADEDIVLAVNDDRSGVAGGSITLTDPNGLTSVESLPGYDPGGSPTAGTYEITVPFNASSTTGTWTVSEVDLRDNTGNTAALTGSKLPTTHSFEVSTHANKPGPPVALHVSPGPGSAALGWQPPADDGGAPVTSYAVTVTPKPAGLHVALSGTGATVTGLASGTTYSFTVRAANLAGTGAPTRPVTLAGSKLAVKPAKLTVAAGRSGKLGVRLTDAKTRHSLAKAKLQLLGKPAGASGFTAVATATTSSKGVATASIRPSVNTIYEWAYSGTAGSRGGALSPGIPVTVTPHLTAVASPGKAVHGHPVKIYGTVTPADVGATVTLQVQAGKKWKALPGSARVAVQQLPDGKTAAGYVLTYTPKAKGKQHLRVAVAASPTAGAGTSAPLTLPVG